MPKPQLFIGSSTEGRRIADGIQANLHADADRTIWNQGVFPLSGFTLESRIQYIPQPAELRIRGDKAEAVGRMVSRGMLEFDGAVSAHGVFHAGVAYMVYTAVDEKRGYLFKGLLFLRVPGFGPITGLWLTEDHIDQTRRGVVIGDLSFGPSR